MRLGSFIVGHRKSVLITYIIAILIAGGIGSLSFSRLDSGGYSDLNSESAKAANYITDTFKVQDPVAILVVDAGTPNLEVVTVPTTNEQYKDIKWGHAWITFKNTSKTGEVRSSLTFAMFAIKDGKIIHEQVIYDTKGLQN